jgi:hypothetical protein
MATGNLPTPVRSMCRKLNVKCQDALSKLSFYHHWFSSQLSAWWYTAHSSHLTNWPSKCILTLIMANRGQNWGHRQIWGPCHWMKTRAYFNRFIIKNSDPISNKTLRYFTTVIRWLKLFRENVFLVIIRTEKFAVDIMQSLNVKASGPCSYHGDLKYLTIKRVAGGVYGSFAV